jgi:hypothetical protein
MKGNSILLLRFIFAFELIIIGYLNISCNAPRVNPFDPLNSDYNYGVIEGIVETINFPRTGIKDVNVVWEKKNIITKTDTNGRFRLDNIPIENGLLTFYKEGYKSDTLVVTWGISKRIYTQVFFNGIPELDSVAIYTLVRNRFSQNPVSELFVKAWITDIERDLDTVFVYNPELNLMEPLEHPEEKTYETVLTEAELNVDDIEQTIGLDFDILIKDTDNNQFIIGSERITRVIKDEVTGQLPSNDSLVVSQPFSFQWNRFRAGYDFTHMIEVYTYDFFNNSQLVHRKENIPSDSTSYYMNQTLAKGNYYWVIWVIDQFQNRSRSKEATFQIQ